MKRYQSTYLFDPGVNAGKMIFLSGPRQVGKTYFVKKRLKAIHNEGLYFNWDDPYIRREYTKNPHFLKKYLARYHKNKPLVAFDEIHKHRNWKNILKGLYDLHSNEAQFIVTGSARLDYFRQSGDSLVGRYFSYKLLPMGLPEAAGNFKSVINDDAFFSQPGNNKLLKILLNINQKKFKESFNRLLKFGGFPEPFLKSNVRFSNKWKRDYKSLLVREDIRELTRIQDLKGIEQLVLLLPEKISAPLSINSLRNDLDVNYRTVKYWIEALKKIYLVFSIMPWHKRLTRALKKEAKLYFYEWSFVENEGARYENAVAVLLLRLVSRYNELGLGDFQLRYLKTLNGHEVDFLIVKDMKPLFMVEAKKSESSITRSGKYFGDLLKIPYYQVVCDIDDVEAYQRDRFTVPAPLFFALTG